MINKSHVKNKNVQSQTVKILDKLLRLDATFGKTSKCCFFFIMNSLKTKIYKPKVVKIKSIFKILLPIC